MACGTSNGTCSDILLLAAHVDAVQVAGGAGDGMTPDLANEMEVAQALQELKGGG